MYSAFAVVLRISRIEGYGEAQPQHVLSPLRLGFATAAVRSPFSSWLIAAAEPILTWYVFGSDG